MRNTIPCILIIILVMSCTSKQEKQRVIDWQGHRGARGNFPENTWPAFQFAMDQQMTTLEMDVVITADSQVVISHEPFLNHVICLDSTGNAISEEDEHAFNIYQMNYDELKAFDCGSKTHPSFLKQTHIASPKPLLKEVLKRVQLYARSHQIEVPYLNVEIKYVAENAQIFHPDIATYSRLVNAVLTQNYEAGKWNIQSFDFDVIKYWHEVYPQVPLAMLVEDNINWRDQTEYLGFTPAIYSPNHIALNGTLINELHEAGMKVIPWTVNEPKVAERLIKQGVDGIITDYPEIAAEFKDNQ